MMGINAMPGQDSNSHFNKPCALIQTCAELAYCTLASNCHCPRDYAQSCAGKKGLHIV